MARVFVLEVGDPNGDGRIRVFRDRAKARRAARRWTGTTGPDASDSEWRGVQGRADYWADLYSVQVE